MWYIFTVRAILKLYSHCWLEARQNIFQYLISSCTQKEIAHSVFNIYKIHKYSGTVLLSTSLFQTLCQTVRCIVNTLMVFSFFHLFRDNLVQEDFQDFQ